MFFTLGACFIALLGIALYFDISSQIRYDVHNEGIVLITGCSTGIGRHAAEYLATATNLTIFAGVRKQEDVDNLTSLSIPRLLPILLDVTEPASREASFNTITTYSADHKLPVVGLVNNAGVASMFPIEFHPLEDARRMFEVNFFAVVALTQMFLPLIRESKGRLVTISSTSGYIASPLKGIYAASKFAIEGLFDSLRRELASHRVSVSLIEPAFVQSEILQYVKTVDASAVSDPVLMQALYGALIKSSEDYARVAHPKGDSPLITSLTIADALLARYPLTRYTVANENGNPAWYVKLKIWLLNDRLEDFVLFS